MMRDLVFGDGISERRILLEMFRKVQFFNSCNDDLHSF